MSPCVKGRSPHTAAEGGPRPAAAGEALEGAPPHQPVAPVAAHLTAGVQRALVGGAPRRVAGHLPIGQTRSMAPVRVWEFNKWNVRFGLIELERAVGPWWRSNLVHFYSSRTQHDEMQNKIQIEVTCANSSYEVKITGFCRYLCSLAAERSRPLWSHCSRRARLSWRQLKQNKGHVSDMWEVEASEPRVLCDSLPATQSHFHNFPLRFPLTHTQ